MPKQAAIPLFTLVVAKVLLRLQFQDVWAELPARMNIQGKGNLRKARETKKSAKDD